MTSVDAFVGRGVSDIPGVATGVALGRGAATCALQPATRKARTRAPKRRGRAT